MSTFTPCLDASFPYWVYGRNQRSSKKDWYMVHSPARVRFRNASDASPVVATMERHREIGGDQSFNWRLVDGILMRSLGSNASNPLTFETVEDAVSHRSSLHADGFFFDWPVPKWNHHPFPREMADSEDAKIYDNRRRRYNIPARDDGQIRAIEADHRDEVMDAYVAHLARIRCLDGVLYAPAPPPAWGFGAGSYSTLKAIAADYDMPGISIPLYDLRDDVSMKPQAFVDKNPSLLIDPRLSPNDLLEAFRDTSPEIGMHFYNQDRITVSDPSAISDDALDDANLRVMHASLMSKISDFQFGAIPFGLVGLLGRLASVTHDYRFGRISSAEAIDVVRSTFLDLPPQPCSHDGVEYDRYCTGKYPLDVANYAECLRAAHVGVRAVREALDVSQDDFSFIHP